MHPSRPEGQGGPRPRRLLFAGFELRLDSGELLRAGSPVKLQPQPAKILEILASRSGEVVSREEIREAVWGDSFVDFDSSLNFCIKQIRRALGDSATSPAFVETVPRRGYRFLQPVHVEPAVGAPAGPAAGPVRPPLPAPPSRRWSRLGTAGVTLTLLLLLTFVIGSRLRSTRSNPRLAVLPLACRSQDPADQQVCGGITEALTAELSRELARDLDVMAPHSALVYSRKKTLAIALGLQPTHVLSAEAEPSVQGLRLTVSLRTASGKRRWQESFDVELKDAPLVYGQIARGVAQALELPPPASRRSGKRAKPSQPAYEAYIRGIYLRRHEQEGPAAAALQNAIVLDPGFAPAYAELALARIDMGAPDVQGLEVTEAAARRALVLDPDLAEAHVALGKILLLRYRDWAAAGHELRTALALNPGSAGAHHEYSIYLAALGRHAEAIASAGRARELDPASMLVGSDYAWYYYLDHRFPEAIRQARAILALDSLSADTAPQAAKGARFYCEDTILNSAWRLGDRETALGAAKAMLEILAIPNAARLHDVEDFWRGREQRIRDLLQKGPVDPYVRAKNAMRLGEPGRALDLLTQQCTPLGMWMPFAAVEPAFDDLHADPRWGQVLDCLKLPADAPARKALPSRR